MKRTPLKTVENKTREYSPDRYKDYNKDAEDIYERPLIFGGKNLNRTQKYEFQDIVKVTYPKGADLSKLSKDEISAMAKTEGSGEAYRYVWDNCIHYLKNVIIEVDGKVEVYDKVEDKKTKDLLWNSAEDFDMDIIQAVSHFLTSSSFSEEESKN